MDKINNGKPLEQINVYGLLCCKIKDMFKYAFNKV